MQTSEEAKNKSNTLRTAKKEEPKKRRRINSIFRFFVYELCVCVCVCRKYTLAVGIYWITWQIHRQLEHFVNRSRTKSQIFYTISFVGKQLRVSVDVRKRRNCTSTLNGWIRRNEISVEIHIKDVKGNKCGNELSNTWSQNDNQPVTKLRKESILKINNFTSKKKRKIRKRIEHFVDTARTHTRTHAARSAREGGGPDCRRREAITRLTMTTLIGALFGKLRFSVRSISSDKMISISVGHTSPDWI